MERWSSKRMKKRWNACKQFLNIGLILAHQVLRVGRGDVVVRREGLGLVAWPISTATGRRKRAEVVLKKK